MNQKTNLFLIGPMGAGKSTIGRHLSSLLGWPFLDTDHVIEEKTGADIPWIFDVEGEEGFREREANTIRELTQRKGIILATGGGAILREDNRSNLKANGYIIYLKTSIEEQLKRTEKDKSRPLLQRGDRREVLERLMATREPLYQAIADKIITTEKKTSKEVARIIAEDLKLG